MTSLSKLRPTGFRIKFKDGALVEYDVVHDGNCGYEVVGEELLRHGIIKSTTREGAIIEVKKLIAKAWMQCGRVVYPGASTSWLEHHIQRSKDIVKLGAGACSGDKTDWLGGEKDLVVLACHLKRDISVRNLTGNIKFGEWHVHPQIPAWLPPNTVGHQDNVVETQDSVVETQDIDVETGLVLNLYGNCYSRLVFESKTPHQLRRVYTLLSCVNVVIC